MIVRQTIDDDLALVRMEETEETGHQRGFAGAVGTDETDDFARHQIEIDTMENLLAPRQRPECLVQGAHADAALRIDAHCCCLRRRPSTISSIFFWWNSFSARCSSPSGTAATSSV